MSNLPAYATNYPVNSNQGLSQSESSILPVPYNAPQYPTQNSHPPQLSGQPNYSQAQYPSRPYGPNYQNTPNCQQQNFGAPPNMSQNQSYPAPLQYPPVQTDIQLGYSSNQPPNMLASHSVPHQIPPQGYPLQGYSQQDPPGSPSHSIANSFFAQAPPVDPQKKANSYVVHWNKAVGLGCLATEKGHMSNGKGFPTYEIALFNINDFFHGRVQPWNTEYAQAIKIFG